MLANKSKQEEKAIRRDDSMQDKFKGAKHKRCNIKIYHAI